MKYLILLLLSLNAHAQSLNCGQTKTSSIIEKKDMEVVTDMPKHLKGSKIIIVKADGSQEILKPEEYMVVKRKHTRPVMSEKVTSNTLQCNSSNVKNIVSLKAINSYGDPDKSIRGQKGTISISRETTLGAQYQRNVGKNIYLGVEGGLNQSAGVMIGLGF
jgi:hypothetical protein